MSRIDSPRLEMALTPLNPLLDVPPLLSGLEPDRRLRWKPPDLKELRRQAINIVRLGNNGMSRAYSPRVKTVIMPFASRPPYPHHPQELWDIIITDRQCTGGMSLVSMCDHKAEGSRLEPLPAPCCRPWLSRLDRRIPQKLLDVEMRERRPANRHVISTLQKESALAHLNLSPFTLYVVRACPVCYPQPSSFKHNRRLSRKPPGLMGMGRSFDNVVKLRVNRTSRSYSPGTETALMPSVPEPLVMRQAPLPYPHPPHRSWDITATKRCVKAAFSIGSCGVEDYHSPEPLPAHPGHPLSLKPGSQSLWNPFDVEMTK
jgi:hypothetical protein